MRDAYGARTKTVDGLQGVERLFVSSMKGQDSICTTFALTVVNRLMRLNTKGERMSEIENQIRVTSSEAIIDIFEQIHLLHKRIDDLWEELRILRAGCSK